MICAVVGGKLREFPQRAESAICRVYPSFGVNSPTTNRSGWRNFGDHGQGSH